MMRRSGLLRCITYVWRLHGGCHDDNVTPNALTFLATWTLTLLTSLHESEICCEYTSAAISLVLPTLSVSSSKVCHTSCIVLMNWFNYAFHCYVNSMPSLIMHLIVMLINAQNQCISDLKCWNNKWSIN